MHPRRLFLYLYVGLFSMLAVWSCRRERFEAQDPNAAESGFSVEQARAFFETQMGDMAATAATTATKGGRGQDGQGEQSGQGEQGGHGGQGEYSWFRGYDEEHPRGFSPGEFTPHWDKAHRGRGSRYVEGVGVPIDPKFHFSALFERQRDGGSEKVQVPVSQQLVVNRWQNHPEWEGEYGYIATLVPTPEYYAGHKNYAQKFRHMGDRAGFSGVVLYHSLSSGRFVNASRYRDGEFTRMVYDRFGTGVDQQAAIEQLMDEPVSFQGGTIQTFMIGMEEDDPWKPGGPAVSSVCTICGTEYDYLGACPRNCCKVCNRTRAECICGTDSGSGSGSDSGQPTGDGSTGNTDDTSDGSISTDIENLKIDPTVEAKHKRWLLKGINNMSLHQIMSVIAYMFGEDGVVLTVVGNFGIEFGQYSRQDFAISFNPIAVTTENEMYMLLVHEYFHGYADRHRFRYTPYSDHPGVGEFIAYTLEAYYMRVLEGKNSYNFYRTSELNNKTMRAALNELFGKEHITMDDIRDFYNSTQHMFYEVTEGEEGDLPSWDEVSLIVNQVFGPIMGML